MTLRVLGHTTFALVETDCAFDKRGPRAHQQVRELPALPILYAISDPCYLPMTHDYRA